MNSLPSTVIYSKASDLPIKMKKRRRGRERKG